MLKLPTCPYCNTIYRYGEVSKTKTEKTHICYNCKKEFKVSKKGIIVLLLLVIVIATIINVFQLYITPSLNILLLLATNVILVLTGILLIPFFIEYKKLKSDKKNKK